MPRTYENDALVNNSSPCITSAHETGNPTIIYGETLATNRKTEAQRRLTAELREYFINYFMRKYPATKKITLRHYYKRYTARVKYVGENPNRTFFVRASTYESLVEKMNDCYAYRGVQVAI